MSTLGINMTPMIDIVFLLIIFFMTVSQITRTIDHPLDLPSVKAGGEAHESISITYNMDAEGQLIIAGQPYSLAEAIEATRREFERVDRQPSRLKILLRGDQNCPGKFVNDLIGRLNNIGISQIRLSIESRE